MPRFNADEHMNRRVVVTERNGNKVFGTIRGLAVNMVDVALDDKHNTRPHFYVPEDTVELLSDEQAALLHAQGEDTE